MPMPTLSVQPRTWAHYALALALLVVLHTLLLSRTPQDGWFEDDPNIVFFVHDNPNPIDYFTDREVLLRLSPNRIFTPMQALSFWLDYRLAGPWPAFFHGHSLLVLWIALCLLWKLLARFLTPPTAFLACALWLLLPSTQSVVEFISARHYLEGFAWMLAALLLAFRSLDSPRHSWLPLCGAMLCYFLAAISKEIYVTSGFWLLLCMYWMAQRRDGAFGVCAVLVAYFLYRGWAIGLMGQGFDEGWRSASSYPLFLTRLPHILTGNDGGYLLFALLLGCLVLLLRRGGLTAGSGFFWLSQLGVALLTVFPVTQHLSAAYLEHGTWYRVVFLVNTLILAFGFWLITRAEQPALRRASMLAALAIVLLGGWTTARQWDRRKQPFHSDSAFYLDYPNRPLYTELPAFYMTGIHNLYQRDQPRHFIAAMDNSNQVLACLARFETVWKRFDSGYRPDADLYRRIGYNHAHGITPLHLPVARSDAWPARPASPSATIQARKNQLVISRNLAGAPLPPVTLDFEGPPVKKGTLILPLPPRPENEPTIWLDNSLAQDSGTKSISITARNMAGNPLAEWRIANEAKTGHPLLGDHFKSRGLEDLFLLEFRGRQPFRARVSQIARPHLPFFSAPLAPAAADIVYFCHIPANPSRFPTQLGFHNPTDAPRELEVELLRGSNSSERISIRLAPHQTHRFHPQPGKQGEPMPIAAIAHSAGGLAPFQILGRAAEEDAVVFSPRQGAAPELWLPAAERTVVNLHQNLAFLNPNDRTVTIRLLDEQGELLDTRKLPPRGKLALSMKVFSGKTISRVRSALPIAGLAVYESAWGQVAVQEFVPQQPSRP